jgi:hypothetical protein
MDLFGRQFSRRLENAIGDFGFADTMQQGAKTQAFGLRKS